MLLIISWKNIWRNKLRSLVVIGAVLVGVFAGTFFLAIMYGMVEEKTQDAINNEIAHIQLHNKQFLQRDEVKYTINNATEIIGEISKMPEVKSVTKRSKFMSMFRSARNDGFAGGFLVGIDLEKEKKVFDIYNQIYDSSGTFFDNNKNKQIVLSKTTAENLKLEYYRIDSVDLLTLRGRIPDLLHTALDSLQGQKYRNKQTFVEAVETVYARRINEEDKRVICKNTSKFKMGKKVQLGLRSVDGIEISPVFRLSGIYKTDNALYDAMHSFVLNKDLNTYSHMENNQAHEIAVVLHDTKQLDSVIETLQKKYPDLKVRGWKDISPEVGMMADMMGFYTIVFMSIILLALGFGIVNTMLMVVLERIKEIGMLMAIGMTKMKVFLMIMYETILLGLIGGTLGMLIGSILINSLKETGVDLSVFSEGIESMGYSSILYPSLDFKFFIQVTIMVIITGILSAVYPAMKAIALKPADAIRSDI